MLKLKIKKTALILKMTGSVILKLKTVKSLLNTQFILMQTKKLFLIFTITNQGITMKEILNLFFIKGVKIHQVIVLKISILTQTEKIYLKINSIS